MSLGGRERVGGVGCVALRSFVLACLGRRSMALPTNCFSAHKGVSLLVFFSRRVVVVAFIRPLCSIAAPT